MLSSAGIDHDLMKTQSIRLKFKSLSNRFDMEINFKNPVGEL